MSAQNINITQIIERAIAFEEDACAFYTNAIAMVEQAHVQKTLQDLADQEVEHKKKLQQLLDGGLSGSLDATPARIQDLKLAEYLTPPVLDAKATFQDVLLVAMNREKSSFDFYSTMIGLAEDEATKKLFEFLAQEELGHKNSIETLYDEVVYQEF